MVEIETDENASRALDQDRTDDISCNSSPRLTWRNLSGPSQIQWPRINCNDLHPRVLSKPLIEDETPDWTIMPKYFLLRRVLAIT